MFQGTLSLSFLKVGEQYMQEKLKIFIKKYLENVRNNHDKKFLNAMEGGKQKLKQFQTTSSFKVL